MKKFFLVVGGIVVLLLSIGFLLPGDYRVERSVVIAAEPATIQSQVADLKTWPEWTAWTRERDPDCQWEFGEKTMKWDGPELGQGELAITSTEPGKQVLYDLEFEGKYSSKGGLVFEREGAQTLVTWFSEGDLGANPVSRYMGLMMDTFMGKDFQEGLEGLKSRVEGGETAQSE